MKRMIIVIWAASLVFILGFSPSWAKTQPKGSITIAVTSLADEPIDPQKSKTQIDRPITDSVGDALVEGDLQGNLAPGVATSWKLLPSTGNKGWEFKLRKGVKFWDGTPVTGEDVKFSIERAMNPKTANEGGPFIRANVERIQVVDNETIIIYSPNPTPWVPLGVAGRYNAIVPKAYVEKVGDEKFNTVEGLLTCGEFKPVEHKKMQHFIMEANEGFYDPARVPRVKRIKLAVVPELSTRMAMLQTGEVDIVDGVAGPTIMQVKSNPKLKLSVSHKTATYFLTPCDLHHPEPSPLKDKRVRQALAHAIDIDSIIKRLYFGEASPAVAIMIPRDVGYDPTLKPWKYDVERAKKLLAEAGYAKGFKVDLQGALTPSTPLCDKVLEAVAGFWGKVGVEVNLRMMESGTYYAKYREKAFRGFAAFSNPVTPDHLSSIWYLAGTGMMYSFYSNPDMDKWLAEQKQEMDPVKRAEIAKKIYNHWHHELVGIPIHHVNTLWATGPRVKEWIPAPYQPYTVGLEYIVPAD